MSYIIAGRENVMLYRAATCLGSLKLYRDFKMIPTRGVTITVMLGIASEYTGVTYKRGQVVKAIADMETFVAEHPPVARPIS